MPLISEKNNFHSRKSKLHQTDEISMSLHKLGILQKGAKIHHQVHYWNIKIIQPERFSTESAKTMLSYKY